MADGVDHSIKGSNVDGVALVVQRKVEGEISGCRSQ